MRGTRRKHGWLTFAIVVGLSGTSGCLSSNHALAPLPPKCMEACQSAPCCCRGKVYVFLVNGFDPFGWERMADVRATLIQAGFPRIYDGQFYHAGWFADEMCRIHADEPDARFALVGIGAGVEVATRLAESLAPDGITIDLLASVDAPFWSSAPSKHPANVQDVLAVHGNSLIGLTTPGAGDNLELPDDSWFGLPAHPLALESLTIRLAGIAALLPAPATTLPTLPSDDSPTPHPLAARPVSRPDAWDFLKPVVHLPNLAPEPVKVTVLSVTAVPPPAR